MAKLNGTARGTRKSLIYSSTLHVIVTQGAPLKEGFHNEYNIETMTYQKWLSPKYFTILCHSPTAQLYVLDIASDRLLLKTATGTGSLSVLLHDV